MSKLVLGLYGFYSYQNYGDNLMAYMLAKFLKEQQLEVLVYSTDDGLSDVVNAKCESSLEDFVASVDLVVLGGGGLLVSHRRQPMSFDKQLSQLVHLCKCKERPIFAISIGGEGQRLSEIRPRARSELLAACKYVTLRNSEELSLLSEAAVDGEYFPDMVWCTPSFLPRSPKDDQEPFTIGVCLRLSPGKRRKVVDILLAFLSLVHSSHKFVYMAVNPKDFEDGTAVDLSAKRGRSVRNNLTDIEQSSDLLTSLDLLVTNKLHVGVVAMSYGVPVVAFGAEEKTALLYHRLGLSRYFWGPREFHKLFLIGSRRFVRNARCYVQKLNRGHAQDAAGHFFKLKEIVEGYRGNLCDRRGEMHS